MSTHAVFLDISEMKIYFSPDKMMKAIVSLVCPSAVFELTDPSGLPAGHIEVTLKWRFSYVPPADAIMTVEEPKLIPGQLEQERHSVEGDESLQEEARELSHRSTSLSTGAAFQVR